MDCPNLPQILTGDPAYDAGQSRQCKWHQTTLEAETSGAEEAKRIRRVSTARPTLGLSFIHYIHWYTRIYSIPIHHELQVGL